MQCTNYFCADLKLRHLVRRQKADRELACYIQLVESIEVIVCIVMEMAQRVTSTCWAPWTPPRKMTTGHKKHHDTGRTTQRLLFQVTFTRLFFGQGHKFLCKVSCDSLYYVVLYISGLPEHSISSACYLGNVWWCSLHGNNGLSRERLAFCRYLISDFSLYVPHIIGIGYVQKSPFSTLLLYICNPWTTSTVNNT